MWGYDRLRARVQSTPPHRPLLPLYGGDTEAQRGHPMGFDLVLS